MIASQACVLASLVRSARQRFTTPHPIRPDPTRVATRQHVVRVKLPNTSLNALKTKSFTCFEVTASINSILAHNPPCLSLRVCLCACRMFRNCDSGGLPRQSHALWISTHRDLQPPFCHAVGCFGCCMELGQRHTAHRA